MDLFNVAESKSPKRGENGSFSYEIHPKIGSKFTDRRFINFCISAWDFLFFGKLKSIMGCQSDFELKVRKYSLSVMFDFTFPVHWPLPMFKVFPFLTRFLISQPITDKVRKTT